LSERFIKCKCLSLPLLFVFIYILGFLFHSHILVFNFTFAFEMMEGRWRVWVLVHIGLCIKIIFFVCVCVCVCVCARGRGVWTQGFMLTCSTAWVTPPALFCVGYFWDRVSQTICLGWLQTPIFLISASWVAWIASVSHQHQAAKISILKSLISVHITCLSLYNK
jgi:hypothetical protein